MTFCHQHASLPIGRAKKHCSTSDLISVDAFPGCCAVQEDKLDRQYRKQHNGPCSVLSAVYGILQVLIFIFIMTFLL